MSSVKAAIPVRESLKALFASPGSLRFIKVELIDDEILADVETQAAVGTWQSDFSLVPSYLKPKQACFVLYRTEEVNTDGQPLWYNLCYVPDNAPVRQKMLYAATRQGLKNDLGVTRFLGEIHGTEPKDFGIEGFAEYQRHLTSAAPLTVTEILKKEEKELGLSEASGTVNFSHGVAFPIDEEVNQAFQEMTDGNLNYIQLSINIDSERIQVKHKGRYNSEEVGTLVPAGDCAFHFYNWEHEYDGDQINSLVFAFSCPDGSGGSRGAPVKQRMLYASSKSSVMQIAANCGLSLACRLEIGSGKEFTEGDYSPLIHPPVAEEKKAFKKPSAPRGRGLGGK
eukprot:TRINITY_DN3138_c0_g1_i18.p1 TRINITY_DN3138_c0_g1~~TRINITY_DN3138_c0_g1_i18.p1  ORF type:complete len:339 (-),score=54.26 TRINITY_DN3138_c0_g1_i18:78-1094(-)